MALTITKNFHSEVIDASNTVLIDFGEPWCSPCQERSPVIHEIAAAQPAIKVGTMNIDEQPQLAQLFAIRVIPTFLVFKKSKVVQQLTGV